MGGLVIYQLNFSASCTASSCNQGGSGGAVTAYSNTWALGRLAPGATARFVWRVTAVSPGTHVVAYDGPYERVTLGHEARSREGFAAGALAAAEWLPGHPGVHTVEDMLFGGDG